MQKPPTPGGATDMPPKPQSNLDESPQKSLGRVHDTYNAWGERLDTFSVHFCYALIGANWAVFDSTEAILGNCYARLSLILALLTLALKMVGLSLVTALLALRVEYAEHDSKRWIREYDAHVGKKTDWPFTKAIMWSADVLRWLKAALPIVAGALLMVAALTDSRAGSRKPEAVPSPTTTHHAACCNDRELVHLRACPPGQDRSYPTHHENPPEEERSVQAEV